MIIGNLFFVEPLVKMPPAARGSFEKSPLDPTKLFIICLFTIFTGCPVFCNFVPGNFKIRNYHFKRSK